MFAIILFLGHEHWASVLCFVFVIASKKLRSFLSLIIERNSAFIRFYRSIGIIDYVFLLMKDDNIYFVGDGAGKAGNIVTAAATGLVAARDILENE